MRYNYIIFSFSKYSFCDYAYPFQISFQDPATPVMEGIIALHHDLFFILVLIGVSVAWMLFRTVYFFHYKRNPLASGVTHATTIEILWTITPSLILMLIAVPSFALLYSMDEVIDPSLTIKVIGHQWYWSYEYSDYSSSCSNSIQYDSYMIPDEDLKQGQLRLLDVDNRMVVPVNTHLRVLVTSADVIHSWAVPSLGIKIDACPGRLNQVSLFIKRCGIFYGQCSEICGVNHGFMPIVVQSVQAEAYINWILAQSDLQTIISNNLDINKVI